MRVSSVGDLRFPVQQIDHDSWVTATLNNAACDFLAGHKTEVGRFLLGRKEPLFKEFLSKLYSWSPEELKEYVEEHKRNSILFLVLMMTGACNADCTICFTDRKKKAGELEIAERNKLIREAASLGAKYIYVPGEGEPTIDGGFWDMLEACKENGVQAVVFTNGILLSDEQSCRRYWNMSIAEAIEKLRGYPVSFYFKLWSMDPGKLGTMMQIDAAKYHFQHYNGYYLPAGLIALLEGFPVQRVGLEIVFEKRNQEEVLEKILPFANEHGLSRIMELVQHNGRTLGEGRFDPDPELVEIVRPQLSFTSCTMATCKVVVTSRGMLSPRIAVLEHQIPGEPVNVRSGPLYDLIHKTDYLVNTRYLVSRCLCEEIPQELAGKSSLNVKVPLTNLNPY